MGRKKETKPLLSKNPHTQHLQPSPLAEKKISKGKPAKPKLLSMSDASNDGNNQGTGGGGSKSKKPKDKCLEKDVDESEQPGPTEEQPLTNPAEQSARAAFGVRSYLHHFYESVQSTTPGQEEEYQYLIHPKGRRCGALWFKVGLIIGATLFLLGGIAIIIGYAIPKQKVILGRSGDLEVIDNDARRFNENLDRCKLIGLAGFCSGGLVLVISLLAPTFTSTYWDEDPAIEPFRVSLGSSHAILSDAAEPKSPIPVTEKIKCIQPVWIE